jgi:hypothetical protein
VPADEKLTAFVELEDRGFIESRAVRDPPEPSCKFQRHVLRRRLKDFSDAKTPPDIARSLQRDS